MDRNVATTVQQQALIAIEALHDALTLTMENCSEEDFQLVRYGVGSSIATINADLLSVIYEQFPDLDHMK